MSAYVLIPGADGRRWYWSRLTPLLRGAGHDVVEVDLPVSDPAAGYAEYADAVVSAIWPSPRDLILVAQSLAGFIAPVVAQRVEVTRLVLLNAMAPKPGETASDWWGNTGQAQARAEHYARQGLTLPQDFDPFEAFFHDCPPEVIEQARAVGEPSQRFDTLFAQPWPLPGWPEVPTHFLQGRNDRFFPLEFQRRVVADRLGLPVEELPGGHMLALSHPLELAERIQALR